MNCTYSRRTKYVWRRWPPSLTSLPVPRRTEGSRLTCVVDGWHTRKHRLEMYEFPPPAPFCMSKRKIIVGLQHWVSQRQLSAMGSNYCTVITKVLFSTDRYNGSVYIDVVHVTRRCPRCWLPDTSTSEIPLMMTVCQYSAITDNQFLHSLSSQYIHFIVCSSFSIFELHLLLLKSVLLLCIKCL